MQSICLLFAGRRGLDDYSMRQSVLRIPEVSRKLKQTQNLIEHFLGHSNYVDLFAYVQAPNEEFDAQQSLKSLVSATVQIGLFDRLVKYRSRPQFLVGRTNGCSAMRVCAGKLSFEDFILKSQYVRENSFGSRFSPHTTKLTGTQLEEFGALQWNLDKGVYENLELDAKDPVMIIEKLSQICLIQQCIHVGPCFQFRMEEFDEAGLHRISSMSSIDLDPILSSFWKTA